MLFLWVPPLQLRWEKCEIWKISNISWQQSHQWYRNFKSTLMTSMRASTLEDLHPDGWWRIEIAIPYCNLAFSIASKPFLSCINLSTTAKKQSYGNLRSFSILKQHWNNLSKDLAEELRKLCLEQLEARISLQNSALKGGAKRVQSRQTNFYERNSWLFK